MSQTADLDGLLRRLGIARNAGAAAPNLDSLSASALEPAVPPVHAETRNQALHRADVPNPAVAASSVRLETGDPPSGVFLPRLPHSLDEAGLSDSDVYKLILKFLMNRGTETGYHIAGQVGMKFVIIEQLMRQLKQDRLVGHRGAVTGGDYFYELTEMGRERARSLSKDCTYFGTAPVPVDQYIASVHAQSITRTKPPLAAIRKAFADMSVSDELLSSVGQAIHSGRGMFLFGNPGNGKTSIAERITRAYGDVIWIPRALSAAGDVVRIYDPNRHQLAPLNDPQLEKTIDGRWVRIVRPTIVAGGELRMENLEITQVRNSGVGEAPLQMKANCGTLLIDDFGRQRMTPVDLLNRWIVPLEQRHDFLQLESGRTIQIPFDELIIFSTNLEPRDLVDDAFLRRIPYKIEVLDPQEPQFRELFLSVSKSMGIHCTPELVEYLLSTHYRPQNRSLRFCHPRDMLRQIENRCTLHDLPLEVTREGLDHAVGNYFSIM